MVGKRWHLGLVGWEEQSSGLKEGILLRGPGLKAAACITLLFIGQSLVTALYKCGELKLGTSKPSDNVSLFSGSLFPHRPNVRL